MIDRGDIPSGNRPLQQYLGHCRALVMVSPEHKADSLIAKFKEAGGTVREIDVWAESPRLSPLWLSASSSACHGLLIITVITPLPTKPSATKMPENWSWRTRQITGQSADAPRCCAWCKIHEGVKQIKLKMMLSAWCCQSSWDISSLSVSAWSHHRLPAWIMQPPPTGRHRRTGLFHPQREADHYAKTTGRNPEVY